MSIGAATTHPVDPHARTAARRHQRIAIAHRSGWPELERRNLLFEPYGIVIHEPDGAGYLIHRGEIDAAHSPIAAYYIDPAGDPVFLEKRTR